MVVLFQGLQEWDELDQHSDLLTLCNEHPANLCKALEGGDRGAIVDALAPVIDNFRLVSSIR